MKKILFLFACTSLILGSCAKSSYLPYHSTAGIDHETRMVQTDMTLMNGESTDTETLSYAVIAALDNDQLPYILIAPVSNSTYEGSNHLWDYNVTYSTTIHPDKAQDLIKSLEVILDKWNVESREKDGYFFEFTHTPEHRIFKNSEDVVTKLPTIQVNFNLTADGSAGSLIIGEGDLKYIYKFEERSDVEKFHDLLENSLQELDEMAD